MMYNVFAFSLTAFGNEKTRPQFASTHGRPDVFQKAEAKRQKLFTVKAKPNGGGVDWLVSPKSMAFKASVWSF